MRPLRPPVCLSLKKSLPSPEGILFAIRLARPELLLWLRCRLRSCALVSATACPHVVMMGLLHLLKLLALFRREDRFNLLLGVVVNGTRLRHAVLLRQ